LAEESGGHKNKSEDPRNPKQPAAATPAKPKFEEIEIYDDDDDDGGGGGEDERFNTRKRSNSTGVAVPSLPDTLLSASLPSFANFVLGSSVDPATVQAQVTRPHVPASRIPTSPHYTPQQFVQPAQAGYPISYPAALGRAVPETYHPGFASMTQQVNPAYTQLIQQSLLYPAAAAAIGGPAAASHATQTLLYTPLINLPMGAHLTPISSHHHHHHHQQQQQLGHPTSAAPTNPHVAAFYSPLPSLARPTISKRP